MAEVDGTAPAGESGFSVTLGNFEGPFDLLLQLIAKHQLDITEVALSMVTTEFIAYTKTLEDDLEQTTHFLLVAATLLDLKTARLLPQAEVEDEDDLELLEARDLLFARLLQYRAFKHVAAFLDERLDREVRRVPRAVTLEPRFAQLLPEVQIPAAIDDLAALAAAALAPKQPPVLSLAHLHAPAVSVREQGHLVVDRLRRERSTTFRALTADAPDVLTKVARFLALLELFREGVLAFDQAVPLGDLTVRWTGSDDGDIDVGDEFDEPDATQAELHVVPDPDFDESDDEPDA
ncbi:segregation/condensation protein A [Aeromicrobium camelliae]|uniref:Segregation and condensation protein A n=1 Tax=Aeromicrobium camelliae TaxID=1538144 RepID=A0A3N6YWQ1_9ACTN|nr:segregation/condensation protein A [Aeromicrobium camelliae]